MSWELLLHHAAPLALKGLTALAGALLLKYKKPLEALGKRLLTRLFPSLAAVHQLSEAEVKELLGAGLESVETLLYLLLKEYDADRVTITAYEPSDGGALATCEVEVRAAEMKSVRSLQRSPIPADLWAEIQAVSLRPGKMRYVPDARAEDSAVLRAALPASGAWSAYYQTMPILPATSVRMLAMSWHQQHSLTEAEVAQLHLSGVACAAVLAIMSKVAPTPEK